MENSSRSKLSIAALILVPALITLGVTILRLEGELQHWSRVLFNPSAGGGGAIIGISWLPFIFGPYFAVKLAGADRGPAGIGRTVGFAILGVILLVAGAVVAFAPVLRFPGKLAVGLALLVLAVAVQFIPWRALAKTLLAYAYAARIPVAVVMFFAIRGSWGTHYDAAPPEAGIASAFWPKYLEIAILPQLVMWIAYTVVVGALIGTLWMAVFRRRRAMAEAA